MYSAFSTFFIFANSVHLHLSTHCFNDCFVGHLRVDGLIVSIVVPHWFLIWSLSWGRLKFFTCTLTISYCYPVFYFLSSIITHCFVSPH